MVRLFGVIQRITNSKNPFSDVTGLRFRGYSCLLIPSLMLSEANNLYKLPNSTKEFLKWNSRKFLFMSVDQAEIISFVQNEKYWAGKRRVSLNIINPPENHIYLFLKLAKSSVFHIP